MLMSKKYIYAQCMDSRILGKNILIAGNGIPLKGEKASLPPSPFFLNKMLCWTILVVGRKFLEHTQKKITKFSV